jgi:hypothetical protein
MREITLTILCILFIVGYFKTCFAIDIQKQRDILWVFLMTLVFSFSMLLNFTLVAENDKLIEKTKNKILLRRTKTLLEILEKTNQEELRLLN